MLVKEREIGMDGMRGWMLQIRNGMNIRLKTY
jgi:hypothetical protein